MAQREILKRGWPYFPHFLGLIFWQNKFEADWETRKALGGVRGHAPPENFWKFTCCNGYFSVFWIIFRQILCKFFDPNFECFVNYDPFCSHIFNNACLSRKANCYQKGSKLWKNCISKTFLKMAGGKMHTLHPTPLSPPQAISYRNHHKTLAYFSHMAPLILFFFIKKQSQGGGERHGPMPSFP